MKSLRLRGGDLVLGPGGFETVNGAARVVQEVRVALAEPLGIDRFHPGWGSLVDEHVGRTINAATAFDLKQEVNRVVGNYMQVQAQKAQRAILRDTPGQYADADLISYVSKVDVTYKQDHASVNITVVTRAGTEVVISSEEDNG